MAQAASLPPGEISATSYPVHSRQAYEFRPFPREDACQNVKLPKSFWLQAPFGASCCVPVLSSRLRFGRRRRRAYDVVCERDNAMGRSEEHTSELQSHVNLVCRLLLEKKKSCGCVPRVEYTPACCSTRSE